MRARLRSSASARLRIDKVEVVVEIIGKVEVEVKGEVDVRGQDQD